MRLVFGTLAIAAALVAVPVRAEGELSAELKAKVDEALKVLGCEGFEEAQQEEEGGIEVEDANCKMGRMDIKFDKDLQVMLISRY